MSPFRARRLARLRPPPYDLPGPTTFAEAQRRVEQIVAGLLPDAVDEVSGGALDPFIASCTADWLARIDTEHADHAGSVEILHGAARELVAAAAAEQDDAYRALQLARADHLAARARLAGDRGDPGEPSRHPADRRGATFADPTLLPGRGVTELVPWALQALALLGDLAAFYTVLALLFRTSPVTLLAIAVGFAAIAVSIAHTSGVLWARLRCGDPRASRILLGSTLSVWLLLGLVAFAARASTPHSSASTGFGAATGHTATGLVTAAVFVGLYLASGVGAVTAAYLQHNPLHTGLRRAATVLRGAVARETRTRVRLARALAVLEQHDRERDRELARRDSARRIALARMAQLQNHARLLIAIGTQDPSHTDGLTGSGPVPELPASYRPLPETR